MNRIMMLGKERCKPSELGNFHFEYRSCENMCEEGEDIGKSRS
jgi:hypothetical protein